MAKNTSLTKAKETKNDEFYTCYEDIQKELNHYEEYFEGKTILCNCDDPFESNFCKFFLRNFNYLKLKRLICTSYHSSSVAGSQLSIFDLIEDTVPIEEGHGYVLDITNVPMANGRGVSDADIDKLLKSKKWVKKLNGNGDFKSDECIEYLKQSDIVVTNPPFSLFRDYVALLMKYNKKFLIIGNLHAITYKEFFPYLKDNIVWKGYGSVKNFIQPNGELKTFGNIGWYTNLDTKKRHEKIVLYKHYDSAEYPKYDNYDAIEVGKVTDIPMDYDGIMGVPLSFLDKHCPEQFEIVGIPTASSNEGSLNLGRDYSKHIGYKQDGTKTGRTGSTFGACPVFVRNDKKNIYYTNGTQTVQAGSCERIFIRRKEQSK